MFFHNINYWTVIISGVTAMALGFVWYSPAVFGKRFLKEMKVTEADIAAFKEKDSMSSMFQRYSPVFLLALVEAFVIAALLNSLVVTSIGGLIVLAVSVWAGFSLPLSVNNMIFQKDSWTLLLITTGYQLVNAILATLIIGIWG